MIPTAKRLRLLCMVLALSVVAQTAYAAGAGTVVARLRQSYGNLTSMSAGFVQEVYYPALGQTTRSEGRMYFKKPSMVRWEYLVPEGDVVVSNGRLLWIYQPDIGQVIETTAEKGLPALAMELILDAGEIENDFTARLVKETSDAYTLELLPKTPQPDIEKLTVEVDKKTFLVVKTTVVDVFGARTTVSLRDIRLDPALDDSLFEFKAPEGTNVIRP